MPEAIQSPLRQFSTNKTELFQSFQFPNLIFRERVLLD